MLVHMCEWHMALCVLHSAFLYPIFSLVEGTKQEVTALLGRLCFFSFLPSYCLAPALALVLRPHNFMSHGEAVQIAAVLQNTTVS